MTGPIWRWSLARTREAIAAGAISPVEAVRSVLARIEERAWVNAYITVLAEAAMAEARACEAAVRAGGPLGPLHGVAISLKDNIASAGAETTAGSPVRAGWIPQEDADIVRRLREAGAIIIGKNNLYEVAYGAAHPRYGETPNPWDPRLSCGGSSNGSASAVADGQAFGAIGTDTGGSIRIPAAMCGVVGLKVSRGVLSNRGIVPVSVDLDAAGPLARSVEDARLLLRAMAGGSGDRPRRRRRAFTVGLAVTGDEGRLAPRVAGALALARLRLEAAGVALREVTFPGLSLATDVMWTIASADIAEHYRQELAERPGDFSPPVRRNLIGGALIPATDYIHARRLQHRLRAETQAVLAGVDGVLLPTIPVDPYPGGADSIFWGGEECRPMGVIMRYTPLANLTGHPAVVVPVTAAEGGPPVTVQLYGRHGRDDVLLQIAGLVERPHVQLPD
jgi:aspartyl-tRNA(Asn)/glutamyl-tRNA(Gln) amidotransferase subunit A